MTYNPAAMKLLPCPFCGSKPIETGSGWAVHHIAGCYLSLDGVGSIYVACGLTKQWNTRAQPQVGEDVLPRADIKFCEFFAHDSNPPFQDGKWFMRGWKCFAGDEVGEKALLAYAEQTKVVNVKRAMTAFGEIVSTEYSPVYPKGYEPAMAVDAPDAVAIVRQLREDLAKIAPHPSGATTDEAPELKASWYEAIAQNALHTADRWLEKVGA